MKINQLRVRNVLGASDISVVLNQPITLFCGFNGAGKSSIQESLRLAFQGVTLRVGLKKDYPLMVTDGAKEGFVKLEADGLVYEYQLPAGTHTLPDGAVQGDQLASVLDAQRFASMSADDRRAFLTVLTKSKPDAKKIRELLTEAGVDEKRIELTIPMLRSGFPAACEIAKQKATEAKGAWKTIAGSTWGSLKSAEWEAPAVTAPEDEAIDEAATRVVNLEQSLSEKQQQLGGLNEKLANAKNRKAEIDAATAKAAGLQRAKDKLVRDQEALDSYEAEVKTLQAKAGTKPKEGLVHELARFIDGLEWEGDLAKEVDVLIDRYEGEFGSVRGAHDPDAAAKLPTMIKSRDLMLTSVANDKRDIAAAEAAAAKLAELGAAEPVNEESITALKAEVTALNAELKEARTDLAGLTDLREAALKRDEKTAAAKAHHLDVVGWLKVAEQFAPDGIPSQILAKALEPINKLLRDAAINTGWFQMAIRPDMTITANSRLYSLLSESEKWMADAMIAGAISQLAGLKLIVLDRFDVLDINHRPALLYWLADMADAGQIECALVFGTLKAVPQGLPDNIEPIWIQRGEVATTEPELEAA